MIRTFLVGGAAALAALLTLTGCSTTPTVSQADVENAISTNLGPQLPAPIDQVTCPGDLTGEVGQKMTCTMSIQGQEVKVEVTVTSVEGNNVNFDMKTVS